MTAFIILLSFVFIVEGLLQFGYFSTDCGEGVSVYFETIGEHVDLIVDPFFDSALQGVGLFEDLFIICVLFSAQFLFELS